MNQYKVIKAMGTFCVEGGEVLPARVLPVGEIFTASAQVPVMLATGKPPRDDVRHRNASRVTAYKVMMGTKYKGLNEYAYTVSGGTRFAVPYTPPAAPKPAAAVKVENSDTESILKRLSALEAKVDGLVERADVLDVAVFDKDGDGVVEQDEVGLASP